MMQIGILYIALGQYDIFWNEFYKSCEELFLRQTPKHYFVFTDSTSIQSSNKVTIIRQDDMGWPKNTLLRFHMFSSIKEQLEVYDYLFFFNANLKVLKEVTSDFLPTEENLLMVLHPSYYKETNADYFPYCRDPQSLAYIPKGCGHYYVQGALNGGKTREYLELIETLREAIDKDLGNSIIAQFHDESHLNHYLIDRTDVKYIGPEFIYPEGWHLDTNPIILSRDKAKYINVNRLKMKKRLYIYTCLKQSIKRFIKFGRRETHE